MDQAFKAIECDFINKFYEHLLFKRSYTNSSVIYSGGQQGMRIDRVLVCEVLDNASNINQCLGAHYAYKLHSEHDKNLRQQENLATFKFDIVKSG